MPDAVWCGSLSVHDEPTSDPHDGRGDRRDSKANVCVTNGRADNVSSFSSGISLFSPPLPVSTHDVASVLHSCGVDSDAAGLGGVAGHGRRDTSTPSPHLNLEAAVDALVADADESVGGNLAATTAACVGRFSGGSLRDARCSSGLDVRSRLPSRCEPSSAAIEAAEKAAAAAQAFEAFSAAAARAEASPGQPGANARRGLRGIHLVEFQVPWG